MTSTIERYHEVAARLDSLIESTPDQTDTSRDAVQKRATFRMARLKRFLARLGDPHRGYPIVHVGGTSGKGSTSTMIAAMLSAAGYTTGLHTSPYLQTPSEKLQLNDRLVDPAQFIDLAEQILTAHDQWLALGEDPLTYGEAWFALTALFFAHNAVDIAVLEVGAGGRFDLTNVVTPALSVITSVGIDHTNTLGETIEDIAWHKAGIIKPGIPAVSAVTIPSARSIIESEAAACRSQLLSIDPGTAITDVVTGGSGTSWSDSASGDHFHTSMRGSFQARNGAIATAAVRQLGNIGIDVSDAAIRAGLRAAMIQGRAEMVDDIVPVLLDGAHNPDKVAALADDIPALLPKGDGARRVAVLGVLEAKQANDMIERLVPAIDVLVATAPRVLAKEPKQAGRIAEIARDAGFAGQVNVEPKPSDAIARALAEAQPGAGDSIIVTGSLYLVGNIRGRWFGEHDIVMSRTAWPRVQADHPTPASG